MEEAAPTANGARLDDAGGALFRRAMFLLGDEAAATRLAEELFVRFVVHAGGERMDPRARWAWIYRVVTAACLRQLPAGPAAARLGLDADSDRLDEATRATIVLRHFDGLDDAELGEVLGPAATRLPIAPALSSTSPHPSSLALDRDPGDQASHLATCTSCQARVAEATRLSEHFAREVAPLARPRVTAAIRAERARQPRGLRWRRLLWMTAAMVVVSGLALLVARPRRPARVDTPYADLKGASRAKKAGLQIVVRRGEEIRNLNPMAALRGGDRLHFRVRADRPRYLEVRVRGPAGEVRVFPEGAGETAAALVRPGQSLDRDYLVAAPPSRPTAGGAPNRLWIVALFGDRPFALDRPPEPEIETVPVRVDLE